jgi:hypothetical protein
MKKSRWRDPGNLGPAAYAAMEKKAARAVRHKADRPLGRLSGRSRRTWLQIAFKRRSGALVRSGWLPRGAELQL